MIQEKNLEENFASKLEDSGWLRLDDINRDNGKLTSVVDTKLLKEKIIQINDISEKLADKALLEIRKQNASSYQELAFLGWQLLTNGVKVIDDESNNLTKTIRLISPYFPQNIYHYVRQFKIESLNNSEKRIPDIVLFVNGLPVVVIELKSTLAEEKLDDAFNQNQSLKTFAPELWKFNILNIVASDTMLCYGSISSSYKRMAKIKGYKTREGQEGIDYLLHPNNLFSFVELYSYYSQEQNEQIKYIAAPHQIEAVKKTMQHLDANAEDPVKGGVIWHTQGSGKSVTMVFLTRAILNTYKKATILLVTDRTELDDQLYTRFAKAANYLNNTPVQIQSRQDLINQLDQKKNFGIYFTTIQKFGDQVQNGLSQRDDIFVLVDEAHRTQNNLSFDWQVNKETRELIERFGYATYLRNAFPNAHFVAFTGTPLMGVEKQTTKIFGDYNHKYLMTDSIEDGTTVKINYELRKINYEFDREYLQKMDELQNAYIEELNKNDLASQVKVDELLRSIKIKEVLENPEIIKAKSRDLLEHYKKRSQVLHGKAMIVAGTRKAAFEYYQQLKALTAQDDELKQITRCDWNDQEIILVMTTSNKDVPEMNAAIVKGEKEHGVAEEFKKPDSKHKIAIVVDKWLTGFDVPDLDTMYLDKIIKWHNLMQAIARVNRTYENPQYQEVKENGLIVDYIGIWRKLRDALLQYTKREDDPNDFSIEDVENAHDSLVQQLKIVEENYLPDLFASYQPDLKNNAQVAYRFIMNAWEQVSNLMVEDRNRFLMMANSVKKFTKVAYSVLSDDEIWASRVVGEVYALQNSSTRFDDARLYATIEQMKALTKQAILVNDKQIIVEEAQINRDLGEVAVLMQQEANELAPTNPKIAVKIITMAIKTIIDKVSTMRPIFAEKASERLQTIVLEFDKTIDAANLLEELNRLFKDLRLDYDQWSQEPPELQAFMEIIGDDEYFQEAKNSPIVEEIATKLVNLIKQQGIVQYDTNPRVRTLILREIKKLLRTDYNYPPERLGGTSKILIDSIDKQIKLNPHYFEESI